MSALLLELIAAAVLAAGPITINTPADPLDTGQAAIFHVEGLDGVDLAKATAACEPSEGVFFAAAQLWGGSPVLWFQASKPGEYRITVSLNGWRRPLDQAIAEGTAARVDPGDLATLRGVADKYELTLGSAVVVVDGEADDDEGDDDPDPFSAARAILLYESKKSPPTTGDLLAQLRATHKLTSREFLAIDQDATTPEDTAHPTVVALRRAIGLEPGEGLPFALVFVDSDDRYVAHIDCPTTAAAVVAELKKQGIEPDD